MADDFLLNLQKPFDRGDLVLSRDRVGVWLGNAVTSVNLERSMEVAPTVTMNVLDPSWSLLKRDDLLWRVDSAGRARIRSDVSMILDGLTFTVGEVEKQDDGEQVVVYDSAVAVLKRLNGADQPFKMTRGSGSGHGTRAQAVQAMCARAGVECVSPQADDLQPVSDLAPDDAKALRAAARSQAKQRAGRSQGARAALTSKTLKVGGQVATAEQRRVLRSALTVADEEGAKARARLALVEALLVESGARNLSGGDADSSGALQVRASTAASMGLDPRDVAAVSRAFLRTGYTGRGGAIQVAREQPDLSAGRVAQTVQGSAFPDRYDAVKADAVLILQQWSPDDSVFGGRTGTPDRAFVKPYEFTVGRTETYWDAMQRLGSQVRWRCFAVNGRVWFVSDDYLRRQDAAYVLSERDEDGRPTDGVDSLRWVGTIGHRIDEMTAVVRLKRWAAPPGSLVVVGGEGVADGDWIIRKVERDLLDTTGTATLTLGRPQKPLPEPASTVQTIPGQDAADTGSGVDASSHVGRAYAKAVQIDARRYPYVWGGGHSNFSGPYDCSGFVSAVLHAAGWLDAPEATTGLATWGAPGKGKRLTVWVKETGNPSASHTFLEFTLPGKGSEFFEAGGTHGAATGRRASRSTAGFQPRHWAAESGVARGPRGPQGLPGSQG